MYFGLFLRACKLSLIVTAVVKGSFSLVLKHFSSCKAPECEKYVPGAPECEKYALLNAENALRAMYFGQFEGLHVLKTLCAQCILTNLRACMS